MKALEASAHVTPVGRDSQGTIKWLHCAAHKMRVLMLIFVKVPILLSFLGFFKLFLSLLSAKRQSLNFSFFLFHEMLNPTPRYFSIQCQLN